jgi:hypothetical protein
MKEPFKRLNCSRCGKFMQKDDICDLELEDAVTQWWVCTGCSLNYPEHLYFKSEIRHSIAKARRDDTA